MTRPQPVATAGHLSRVTLAGARRRIDLVLPADEPVGLLLPEVVGMVDHRPVEDSRGYQISTLDGTVLDPRAAYARRAYPTARCSGSTRSPRRHRRRSCTTSPTRSATTWPGQPGPGGGTPPAGLDRDHHVLLIAATVAAVVAGPRLGPVPVGLLAGTVALTGLFAGLAGRRSVGVAVLLSGAAMVATTVPGWTDDQVLRWTLWTIVVGCALLAVGVLTGNRRAGLLGGGTLLVLVAAWSVPLLLGVAAGRVAAALAVVSVGLLGLLPGSR